MSDDAGGQSYNEPLRPVAASTASRKSDGHAADRCCTCEKVCIGLLAASAVFFGAVAISLPLVAWDQFYEQTAESANFSTPTASGTESFVRWVGARRGGLVGCVCFLGRLLR